MGTLSFMPTPRFGPNRKLTKNSGLWLKISCQILRHFLKNCHKGDVFVLKPQSKLFKNKGSKLFEIGIYFVQRWREILYAVGCISLVIIVENLVDLEIRKKSCSHYFGNMNSFHPLQPFHFNFLIDPNGNVV
jgi:hypothetical protein